MGEDLPVYRDPGRGPFEEVATEDLIERCGLDPDILASIDASVDYPYAVVRYGLLCHVYYPEEEDWGPEVIVENLSATKTLAAAAFGRAAARVERHLDGLSGLPRSDRLARLGQRLRRQVVHLELR